MTGDRFSGSDAERHRRGFARGLDHASGLREAAHTSKPPCRLDPQLVAGVAVQPQPLRSLDAVSAQSKRFREPARIIERLTGIDIAAHNLVAELEVESDAKTSSPAFDRTDVLAD